MICPIKGLAPTLPPPYASKCQPMQAIASQRKHMPANASKRQHTHANTSKCKQANASKQARKQASKQARKAEQASKQASKERCQTCTPRIHDDLQTFRSYSEAMDMLWISARSHRSLLVTM